LRASRLLSIQMLLETRGRMSARALADALEISIRTLYRDIDELTAAGVPVYAERGRAGGFELMRGWKTTLTGLTPSEAQAVFLSGLAGPAAELGLGDQVEQAQLKLLAALPASWRDDARRVSSRLYLDPIDWYRESMPLPHLATVATAVWDERPLSIHYESWKLTSRRTIDPLGLVLKAGAWYLVAAGDDKIRTYRVASILAAELQHGVVKRPKGFSLTEHWRQSVQRFETEVFKGEATVRASAVGLKNLSYLSAAVAKAVAAVAPPEGEQARIELRIPIETIEHATGQLLRLAPEVEVIGPPPLKRATIERLRRIVALYGLNG
jgi:predicted DNA-binding transcriptional regulator YafY